MDERLVVYEGFFFENLGGMLKNVVEHQHMTTQFLPTFYHTIMYGRKAKFKVVGYANDGRNEGLRLEMVEGDEKNAGFVWACSKSSFDTLGLRGG